MNLFSKFKNLAYLMAFATMGILIPFPILAQTTSTNDDPTGRICCYAILLPLWVISLWYWWRHYYVRNGIGCAIGGIIVAFFFSGLSVFAMILDFFIRAITGNRTQTDSCPNCGKSKLYPHEKQPNALTAMSLSLSMGNQFMQRDHLAGQTNNYKC